jgi:hypothetical protein
MWVVGVLGYAGTGKDEVGKILVERYNFQRVAFADKVRATARAVDPYVRVPRKFWLPKYVRLSQIIPDDDTSASWEEVKKIPDVRRLLQRIGTEAGRHVLGESIWIESTFKDMQYDSNWVVTDARFLNEFHAIESSGGFTIRVRRPGTGPLNDHPSETEQDQYHANFTINNDGSLRELHDKVDSILYEIRQDVLSAQGEKIDDRTV